MTVSKHTALSQTGSEGGDIVPACHGHLVERLSMCPLNVLHHHIAMDEVRADPGRVEAGATAIQEHHAHYVIPYVTLLVYLKGKWN